VEVERGGYFRRNVRLDVPLMVMGHHRTTAFTSLVMVEDRPGLVPKNFHSKLSHQILRYMHGILNIDEKKLIVQFGWKSRDKCFKTN